MRVDSLPRNLVAYMLFFTLAIVIGVLESVHTQLQNGRAIDWYAVLDSAIAAILPSLVLTLGAMKLPSVGHEEIASKVDAHEDRLRVETPAEHKADVAEGGRG